MSESCWRSPMYLWPTADPPPEPPPPRFKRKPPLDMVPTQPSKPLFYPPVKPPRPRDPIHFYPPKEPPLDPARAALMEETPWWERGTYKGLLDVDDPAHNAPPPVSELVDEPPARFGSPPQTPDPHFMPRARLAPMTPTSPPRSRSPRPQWDGRPATATGPVLVGRHAICGSPRKPIGGGVPLTSIHTRAPDMFDWRAMDADEASSPKLANARRLAFQYLQPISSQHRPRKLPRTLPPGYRAMSVGVAPQLRRLHQTPSVSRLRHTASAPEL